MKLNITDELVIKRLRVCHKYFHNNDYSCSPNYRRLINTAVPHMELECTEQTGTQEVSQQLAVNIKTSQQEILKEMEGLPHEQQEKIELLHQQQEIIQERMEVLQHEQQEKKELLYQHQKEIQNRMDLVHHEQQEKIDLLSQSQEKIEKQLTENRKRTLLVRRPNLLEIKRQKH